MPFYWFVVGSLAVWRITHLFHAEDGPWEVLLSLRRAVGTGAAGKVLDCFFCLSVWVAAPIAFWIGHGWQERLLLWPALSGAAILLQRCSSTPERLEAPPPYDLEEPNDLTQADAPTDHRNNPNQANG